MAPKQKPGNSKQDYGTPDDFLAAVRTKLAIEQFDIDLAADSENTVVPGLYFDKETDALAQPSWQFGDGWNWLNPPFKRIAPWAEKSFREAKDNGVNTAMLVPAGVGADWWAAWVHEKADVLFLNGRLVFKGTPINPNTGKPDYYPKDCALVLYSAPARACGGSYDVWKWRT